MWGTHLRQVVCADEDRFIPTHVGNTNNWASAPWTVSVHPHACGEHGGPPPGPPPATGSSPRMWGTPAVGRRAPPGTRFIPTHVGNTHKVPHEPGLSAVHPHACGEHRFCLANLEGKLGSSPRMWGTPRSPGRGCTRERFIPTHVGNTTARYGAPVAGSVHPHACGEHLHTWGCGGAPFGSSPRMWGTLLQGVECVQRLRFIPTHVGNTTAGLAVSPQRAVHPHACGEHIGGSRKNQRYVGSSPRMWGTPPPGLWYRSRPRFIPTHVGNTSHKG